MLFGGGRVTADVILLFAHLQCPGTQDATDHGMKFFTLDWWCGLQELGDYDPIPEFRMHLATIRDRLPKGLLALQETVSLHDAKLRSLDYSKYDNPLTLQLDGDDRTGGLRQFTIRYTDLISHRITADPELGLLGPHGFGDLGYDEADITTDGDFEHRLLFSTGIELQIVFRDLELKWDDAK
jgi:hypothetical protein